MTATAHEAHTGHAGHDVPGDHSGHGRHSAGHGGDSAGHGGSSAGHGGSSAGHGESSAGHGAGHSAAHGGGHAGHAAAFRDRFWLSLLLAVPVVIYSHMLMELFGYVPPAFPGSGLVAPVLGSVVFWWGGWPFLSGGVAELRARRPGMMLLVATAVTVAYAASVGTELGLVHGLDLWFEVATLVTVMLLGHWLEMRALGQASDALAALADLLPDEAEVLHGDHVMTVRAGELRPGDLVLVRSGGRVPADGVVVEGAAEVDESMVTGESRPVPRAAGDRVVAGTVATDSSLRVRVTAVGDDTALAGIRRLVEGAQASRGRAQALADRAAAALFYVAIVAGALTFAAWALVSGAERAVAYTVAVLVVSCPHALSMAMPLVTSVSSALAARAGILVKDRVALERMRTVDAVLFDKTGTLTRGAFAVVGTVTAGGLSDAGALAIAAAVEADSEHPLARALVAAAPGGRRATGFRSLTGRGVEATVDGVRYAVGGPALLRERAATDPLPTGPWRERGAVVLYLLREDEVVAAFGLEDEVRPEAREAVAALRAQGVRVVMITGDARQVADAVGAELGVDEVVAEVLPEHKDAAVAELQSRGLRVAMVGDGVNDAPALARADVGIAIGAGTDVAIESAGIVLASSDPRGVLGIRRLSRASYRKMLQNLAWAAGYNVVAIPVAAGALAWAGVTLAPAVAAVLMSGSTIVVALNAQLLRRLDLRP